MDIRNRKNIRFFINFYACFLPEDFLKEYALQGEITFLLQNHCNCLQICNL